MDIVADALISFTSAVAVHHAADYVAPDDLASPVGHAPIIIETSQADKTGCAILIGQSGFSRYVLRHYSAHTLACTAIDDGKKPKKFSSLSDAEKQTFLDVCRQCPDTYGYRSHMVNIDARCQKHAHERTSGYVTKAVRYVKLVVNKPQYLSFPRKI